MRGSIAIPEIVVLYNKMNWSVFEVFTYELAKRTTDPTAGWYAHIKQAGVYIFLWCDRDSPPSQKYLDALKKEGFTLGISSDVIREAFSKEK
jgi:hypothetical protein